jgi:hypothetical protein
MYTYIYTEKTMNFYRTGKVQGVTANETLNLNNSSFKHKAVMIPNGAFTASPSFFITMGDPTTGTPLGITLVTQSNTIGQLPYIFPGVIQSIRPTATGRIVLLG